MGAAQSNLSSHGEKSVSLYEIIGVEKNCTDAELKKAYKKQALLLHPDRNIDDVESATSQFARVQAAYDVLSDPQERAWYDRHTSETKSSTGRPSYRNEYSVQVLSVEEIRAYMNPLAYTNVAKNRSKFYEQVGMLFGRIKREELEAELDREGFDHTSRSDATFLPDFPSSDVSEEEYIGVKRFYDHWLSFNSVKSFAWEDIYRSWDGADRRSRRAMESSNKKVRDQARREYSEAVRSLVTFIRRRDPRVKAHIQKSRDNEDTLERANAGAKAQAERAKREKNNGGKKYTFEEQPWMKADSDELDASMSFDDGRSRKKPDGQSGDELEELFECVACNKPFKTKKQLVAHELSKKHLKNVQKLKKEILQEDQNIYEAQEEDQPPHVTEEPETTLECRPEVDAADETAKLMEEKTSQDETAEQPDDAEVDQELTVEQLLAQLEGTRVSHEGVEPRKKPGKAKQKKLKKNRPVASIVCNTCRAQFTSRNMLFDHVKETGHARAG